MKIVGSVNWTRDVLPVWKKRNNASNEISALADVEWHSCIIEENDLDKLWVAGCCTWTAVYRGHKFKSVAMDAGTDDITVEGEIDESHHRSRIASLQESVLKGCVFDPIILIAPSADEDIVIADGNHRALALYREQDRLSGTDAFIGYGESIRTYSLYRNALTYTR